MQITQCHAGTGVSQQCLAMTIKIRAHLYVKEDGWEGFYHGPWKWDWSSFGLRNGWEIPAPDWAQKRELEDFLAGTGKVEATEGSGMGGETAVVERGDFGKCEGEGEEEEKEKESEVKEEKVKEKLKVKERRGVRSRMEKGRRMHRSQIRQRVEL